MNTIKLEAEEKLNSTLDKMVYEEINNKDLIDNIVKEFNSKGINSALVNTLFSGSYKWDLLDNMTLIALVKSAYEILKWELLNPSNLFSDQLLNEYQVFNIEEEKKIDIIELDNMQKISETEYLGKISYKQIYLLRKNGLLFYNLATQRAGDLVEIGTKGMIIRKMSLNMKAVNEIKNLMLKGEYESDTIVLNSRLIKDKEMNFREDVVYEPANIYNISIKPDYNVDSESQTIVDELDGSHRITAVCKAVEEYKNRTDKWLEGHLLLRLVIRDIEGAKRIVAQTFERSDTDEGWKNVLKSDDYVKFINRLIPKVYILKDNVANTFNECIIGKNITYKDVLIKALKSCDIKVESKSASTLAEKGISETLNDIFDYMINTFFDKDIDNMIQSNMLDSGLWYGYFILADELRNKSYEELVSSCDNLYLQLSEIDIRNELASNKKNYKINKITDLFLKVTEEK